MIQKTDIVQDCIDAFKFPTRSIKGAPVVVLCDAPPVEATRQSLPMAIQHHEMWALMVRQLGFVKRLEIHAHKGRGDAFGATLKGARWVDGLHLLRRALHIVGIVRRIVQLVRMPKAIYSDSEFREDVDDAQVLCILRGADIRRGCPLKHQVMDETEWLVQHRLTPKYPPSPLSFN